MAKRAKILNLVHYITVIELELMKELHVLNTISLDPLQNSQYFITVLYHHGFYSMSASLNSLRSLQIKKKLSSKKMQFKKNWLFWLVNSIFR